MERTVRGRAVASAEDLGGDERRARIIRLALAATLATLLGLPLAGSAAGQETGGRGPDADPVFTGRVLDASTLTPLQGVWVGLEGQDWGTITNADGLFRLPDVPASPSVYAFEMLGYVNLRLTADPTQNRSADVLLAPDPIVLEGIEIVADRFESRRKATPVSVQAMDRKQLLNSNQLDALELLEFRFGIRQVPCRGSPRMSLFNIAVLNDCTWIRGRPEPVTVCIDEMPVAGGINFLTNYPLHEIYLMEVYGRGRQVRIYTNQFMERAGRTRLNPTPLVASMC